jgi:hypothetical protein
MSEKLAIVLMAGPEAPCRLVHTFIWAIDITNQDGQARIIFEGASPAWLPELTNPDHPHHRLYQKIKEHGLIAAVCQACAMQADALEAAQAEGLLVVNDASGHVSLAPYMEAGYTILTL